MVRKYKPGPPCTARPFLYTVIGEKWHSNLLEMPFE